MGMPPQVVVQSQGGISGQSMLQSMGMGSPIVQTPQVVMQSPMVSVAYSYNNIGGKKCFRAADGRYLMAEEGTKYNSVMTVFRFLVY
jgi:hypothetical protein